MPRRNPVVRRSPHYGPEWSRKMMKKLRRDWERRRYTPQPSPATGDDEEEADAPLAA